MESSMEEDAEELPVASGSSSPTPTLSIIELPVEVLGLIVDFVDAQTRAEMRLAHPLLARGVWHVENKWAKKCELARVGMPSKKFFLKAARIGVGINYRPILYANIYGTNLYNLIDRMPLIDLCTNWPLPPRIDENGKSITGGCVRIPYPALHGPREREVDACGKLSMALNLPKCGFNIALLRANLVQFTVEIIGYKLANDGDINAVGGLVCYGSYKEYTFFDQTREEGDVIPTWGRKITLRLQTLPVFPEDGNLDRLNLNITIKNNFALTHLNIRAIPLEVVE